MEKERKIKALSLVALIVAVLGLTVAFAALSQTLTINGTASVNAAEWDVHFANLSEPVIEGAATSTKPTLSNLEITGYSATVTKPGDSVVYEFDIVNAGTIDATLSNITFPLSYSKCTGVISSSDRWEECKIYDLNKDNSITAADYVKIKQLFNYGLFYVDTSTELKRNDVLAAGETKRVKLVVEYDYDAEELPENNFTIFDSSKPIKLDFEQAD